MKIDLVRIGNSRGIRIPKPLIEECGLGDTVELTVEKNRLVITPEHRARKGWKQAFAAAASPSHNQLSLEHSPANVFDTAEWTW
jgi:antitoxin MazE